MYIDHETRDKWNFKPLMLTCETFLVFKDTEILNSMIRPGSWFTQEWDLHGHQDAAVPEHGCVTPIEATVTRACKS